MTVQYICVFYFVPNVGLCARQEVNEVSIFALDADREPWSPYVASAGRPVGGPALHVGLGLVTDALDVGA